MRKFEGLQIPDSWEDITIKQFSEYNKLLADFNEAVKDLDPESGDPHSNQILIEEIKLNFNIIESLSGLDESDIYSMDIGLAKAYVKELSFLVTPYEGKEIKSFHFNGVNYNVPNELSTETKFGQYVEALQAEMVTASTDKNSVTYLAHQLAHVVDNGEDWDGEYRDKLALDFENLPCSIGLDFAFFLSKKFQIYSLAYHVYESQQEVKRLPFIKIILLRLGGLKHYMSWRRLKYSISLIKLLLIVFYTQIRGKFSNIYRILQRRVTLRLKSMKLIINNQL